MRIENKVVQLNLVKRLADRGQPYDGPAASPGSLPASVDVVVEVPGGTLTVALGAPAPAVGLVPHLVRTLEEARRLGGAVHALTAAQVLVEVLKKEFRIDGDIHGMFSVSAIDS